MMSATLWLLLLSSVLASGEAHVVANGVARRARTRWKKGVPAMKNAPPIRRGAEKAELAAAMAAAATSRTGTHAAMVAIVKSLFRVEEPAEEPAEEPDDNASVSSSSSEESESSDDEAPAEEAPAPAEEAPAEAPAVITCDAVIQFGAKKGQTCGRPVVPGTTRCELVLHKAK